MRLRELIQQSWAALRRNPMRSSLTMLGITWGVISVVLLLAFGRGLGGSVTTAMGNMGNNVIVIWPGQTSMQAGGQRAGQFVHFEYADVEAIRADDPWFAPSAPNLALTSVSRSARALFPLLLAASNCPTDPCAAC